MAKKERMEENQDEITEEVVQAVATAIVNEAEEQNKEVAEIVDEIIEEANEANDEEPKEMTDIITNYSGDLRGFSTLEEALNYPNTKEFERLDIGCQTEYKNWLKSITEEEK